MRPLGYLVIAAFTAIAAAGCPTGQLTSSNGGKGAEGGAVPISPMDDPLDRVLDESAADATDSRPREYESLTGFSGHESESPVPVVEHQTAPEATPPVVQPGQPLVLPAAFPRDVPLYTRGELTSSGEEVNGFFVELWTKDSTAQVNGFFERRLREYGWRVSSANVDARDSDIILATKDDRLLMLVSQQWSNQTRVTVSISYSSGLQGG